MNGPTTLIDRAGVVASGTEPPRIELRGLTKRYGQVTAVDDLTVDIEPGRVTGFLGPNGAGKSTTLRMILGLDRPSAGAARIGGIPYARLARPIRTVGALLDARAVHPGRTAAGQLRALARSNGVPGGRVDRVLAEVGLSDVAGHRAGTFSLGMLQRLGVAAALLGDPAVLLFDEPVNGLDPEGIRWIRGLMRGLAGQGRTVLLSSHLMSEMALTADHVVVIGRGRLIADVGTQALLRSVTGPIGVALAPHGSQDGDPDAAEVERFSLRLVHAGGTVSRAPDRGLSVAGLSSVEIGRLAAADGVALAELVPHRPSLEDVFMDLTRDSLEYVADRNQAVGA